MVLIFALVKVGKADTGPTNDFNTILYIFLKMNFHKICEILDLFSVSVGISK